MPPDCTSYETVAKKLTGKRVMLIGGAGFIGHNLALELSQLGADVMIVDNLMVNSLIDNVFDSQQKPAQRGVYLNFLLDRYALMREEKILLRNSDARLFGDLTQLFDSFRPQHVIHLAAIASSVSARENPGLCFDLQLITLRNILELCRLSGDTVEQLVLLSSSTVYGDFKTPSVDENVRPQPKGIYANAKYMAERLVRTYCHQHGLGVTIIRPSALYGERCISRRVSQVFIENALNGKPLLLEGGGDGRLDFTYIGDLVNGISRSLAFHAGPGRSETYNLTYGDARTIADLASIVKGVIPGAMLEHRPRAEDKPTRGTLSIDRARKYLGFEPQWPLEKGYKRYCQWYVDQWERVGRADNR